MTLAGPQAYTVEEVIELCEKYAGADADVTKVPVWLLRLTRNVLRGFQWARDAADRLVRASRFYKSILKWSTHVYADQMQCVYRAALCASLGKRAAPRRGASGRE